MLGSNRDEKCGKASEESGFVEEWGRRGQDEGEAVQWEGALKGEDNRDDRGHALTVSEARIASISQLNLLLCWVWHNFPSKKYLNTETVPHFHSDLVVLNINQNPYDYDHFRSTKMIQIEK